MTNASYQALLAEKDQQIARLVEALEPFARAAQRFPVNPNPLRESRLSEAILWSAGQFNPENPGELITWQITVQQIRNAAKTLEDVGGCQ